jgi:GNAT superfamily N-acetyltransferase
MGRPGDVQVIRWCGEEARTAPWRGDRSTALLTPLSEVSGPSTAFLSRCLDELAAHGFSRVLTPALGPLEQVPYMGAGFRVEERLAVLTHDLRRLPRPPRIPSICLRRGRMSDRPEVLVVDNLAFSEFWRLDWRGIEEALAATPLSRWRVAVNGAGSVIGYAVTGRAGGRGFLQRLAVHPEQCGRGVGRTLVLDGLRWLRRWRVEQVLVNTQVGNFRALALYEGLGFRAGPAGLSVLSAGLAQ